MVVILSIFDVVIGPVPFIVIPSDFSKLIAGKVAEQINYGSNDYEEISTVEYPDSGLTSINVQLTVNSPVARGKKEVVQISTFTTEENPSFAVIKNRLIETKKKIISNPDAFKGFYTKKYMHTKGAISKDEAEKSHRYLIGVLQELESSLKVDLPSTNGYTTDVNSFSNENGLTIPSRFLNEIKQSWYNTGKNFFVVFRKDGDGNISVKIIPSERSVVKLKVLAVKFTPELLMKFKNAITLPLIFTTGLCQEVTGRCSYEAYFSCNGVDIQKIKEGILSKLKGLDFVVDASIEPVPILTR